MEVIARASDYLLCTLILSECCPIYTPMREFPQYTPMRKDTHTHVSYNGYTNVSYITSISIKTCSLVKFSNVITSIATTQM